MKNLRKIKDTATKLELFHCWASFEIAGFNCELSGSALQVPFS